MNDIVWHETLERTAALYPELPELRRALDAAKLNSRLEELVADDLENFQRELKVYSAEFRHRVKAQTASPEEVAQRLQVREKTKSDDQVKKTITSAGNPPRVLEKCYSPDALADAWGYSADTIRKMFENEPGVQIMGNKQSTRHKRRYRTMKIPESVARRVWNRLASRREPLKGE
jgi:hypothetical protein